MILIYFFAFSLHQTSFDVFLFHAISITPCQTPKLLEPKLKNVKILILCISIKNALLFGSSAIKTFIDKQAARKTVFSSLFTKRLYFHLPFTSIFLNLSIKKLSKTNLLFFEILVPDSFLLVILQWIFWWLWQLHNVCIKW